MLLWISGYVVSGHKFHLLMLDISEKKTLANDVVNDASFTNNAQAAIIAVAIKCKKAVLGCTVFDLPDWQTFAVIDQLDEHRFGKLSQVLNAPKRKINGFPCSVANSVRKILQGHFACVLRT